MWNVELEEKDASVLQVTNIQGTCLVGSVNVSYKHTKFMINNGPGDALALLKTMLLKPLGI